MTVFVTVEALRHSASLGEPFAVLDFVVDNEATVYFFC